MSKSRNNANRKVDSTQVLQALLTLIRSRLPLDLQNTRITEDELLEVLTYACVHQTSIDTACLELDGAASANRLREVLMAALPTRDRLQRALNTILHKQVHRSLFKGKRSYCIALDITLIPYHGHIERDDPTVVRAKAKAGTNQFHGYATVSIVHNRRRYVLALRLVHPHESMVSIVRDLLNRVRCLKIAVRRVYLDKEFYAVEVFRTLDRRHLAYVVPVPVKRNTKGKPTALQVLCRGRRSYTTTYTLHPAHGRHYTVSLVLVKRNRRRKQKKVVRWFVYAVAGLPAQITPHGVFQLYRHRFGIETSYRQLHQVRARTSSRNATLRLLLVGLAFILINLYVTLRTVIHTYSETGDICRRSWLSLRRLSFLLGRAVDALFSPPTLVQQRPSDLFS